MYNLPTLEELIENLENAYNAAQTDIKTMPLSVQKANARIFGYALNALYGYLGYIARQAIPITSEGVYLRRHCATIGLTEKPQTAANGYIKVTGTIGKYLKAGERLTRTDGISYIVLEDTQITSEQQLVKVEAVETGSNGNCVSGTVLTFVRALEGISSTAVVDLIGAGADAETDAELLQRYLIYMQNLYYGGADTDYIKWALSVPGVTYAWVEGCAMGVGTVTVRIMTATGTPDNILCQKVYDYIRSVCPVTVKRVFVVAPATKVITVEIANLSPDTPEMRADITNALQQYFTSESVPGGQILVSKINSVILSTFNLTDYKLIAPLDNIQCGVGELAVLGGITWS